MFGKKTYRKESENIYKIEYLEEKARKTNAILKNVKNCKLRPDGAKRTNSGHFSA